MWRGSASSPTGAWAGGERFGGDFQLMPLKADDRWKTRSNSAIISGKLTRSPNDESPSHSSPQPDLCAADRIAVGRGHGATCRSGFARAALAVLLRSLSEGCTARGGGR